MTWYGGLVGGWCCGANDGEQSIPWPDPVSIDGGVARRHALGRWVDESSAFDLEQTDSVAFDGYAPAASP